MRERAREPLRVGERWSPPSPASQSCGHTQAHCLPLVPVKLPSVCSPVASARTRKSMPGHLGYRKKKKFPSYLRKRRKTEISTLGRDFSVLHLFEHRNTASGTMSCNASVERQILILCAILSAKGAPGRRVCPCEHPLLLKYQCPGHAEQVIAIKDISSCLAL